MDVVYFDAGSGHRSAARAIEGALRDRHPEWAIRAVNLVDLVRHHKLFQITTRLGIDYFNSMLKRDRVRDLPRLIRFCLWCCDRVTPAGCASIARFWGDSPPDALISVTSMNNEVLHRSLRIANPAALYVTIPVDLEETLPRYWFTPAVDAHYLLASDRLLDQGREAGVPQPALHRISGMPIDSAFYGPPTEEREAALERLRLDPHLPVCLVSFGGQGSDILLELAEALASGSRQMNLIFLCGRNGGIAHKLRQQRLACPKLVLDYLPDTPVPYYRLADFVVGKPGSMTIFESLACGAPLLAMKSGGMAPVQRGNERWLEQSGSGLVVATPSDLPAAAARVLDRLADCRAAAQVHAGRGVFEAADLMESLLG